MRYMVLGPFNGSRSQVDVAPLGSRYTWNCEGGGDADLYANCDQSRASSKRGGSQISPATSRISPTTHIGEIGRLGWHMQACRPGVSKEFRGVSTGVGEHGPPGKYS